MPTSASLLPTEPTPRRAGRPRDVAVDEVILQATLALAGEVGLAGLTVDAVAARAGVSKATIYRRWSSKEALVLSAWRECAEPPLVPDTGSLRGDLQAVCENLVDKVGKGAMFTVFPQMVAAARTNPDLAEEFDRFITDRREPLAAVLRRARDRGELRTDVDLALVQDLFVGPLMYRLLVTGAAIDATVLSQLLNLLLRAVQPD